MKNIKEAIRNIVKEESEYQTFFKKALEKSGKSITDMSDDEKKAFFNKIDAAWDGKGEKNEELVGNQHKLDVDGDGEIEASDLAALRAGKKADESIEEGKLGDTWRKNNKKGYVLKVGNIELKSAGPSNSHDILVNRMPWGTFAIDYEAGGTDWWVKPLRGSDFWVDTIEDLIKKVKADKRFNESLSEGKKKDESINKGNIVEKKFSSKYDIGMGTMGNGTTIWNRAKEVRGDYETIAHVSNSGEVKFYDKSLPSDVKKYIEDYAKTQKESKLTESQLNENFSPSDVQKIKKAVQDSATFMQIGRGLQKLGFKYSFGTSPYPIYMIKKGTKTYVLINKKYADDPEFVIGDTAGGLLEGVTKSTKSITEGKFKEDDLVYNKRTKTVGIVRMGDDKYGEVKTDADGNVSVDELEKFNPIKHKHHQNAKVAPSTEKEINKRGLFNPFKNESINESKFKSGDKVSISHPTMTKPVKGVVSMVVNASGNEVLVLKGDGGVWDAKFATLNEGNAFGAAVTAAKKEGKKEFEFNGKKYKVKKGSYEKNESAKKVNEAIDVKYWEDYNKKSPKITSIDKLKSVVDTAVNKWNSDVDDKSNLVNSIGKQKVLKLANEFFKASGYISHDIVMAMIMQES